MREPSTNDDERTIRCIVRRLMLAGFQAADAEDATMTGWLALHDARQRGKFDDSGGDVLAMRERAYWRVAAYRLAQRRGWKPGSVREPHPTYGDCTTSAQAREPDPAHAALVAVDGASIGATPAGKTYLGDASKEQRHRALKGLRVAWWCR